MLRQGLLLGVLALPCLVYSCGPGAPYLSVFFLSLEPSVSLSPGSSSFVYLLFFASPPSWEESCRRGTYLTSSMSLLLYLIGGEVGSVAFRVARYFALGFWRHPASVWMPLWFSVLPLMTFPFPSALAFSLSLESYRRLFLLQESWISQGYTIFHQICVWSVFIKFCRFHHLQLVQHFVHF